ncbi:uncharacterized protein LOC129918030 [Episyrphus balteatus]|uniref:uncharacterized protein LOC129918030 n=1 Tax=Episyrphus balteatus TaxID=286459 RepID=UPI002485C3FC|nr:uncharacterized protein LOC129918030 [Episyrphus balteatus]
MSDTEESTGPSLKCEEFIITPNFTLEDYENNWAEHLCDIDFEERDKIFHKFYNHIWNLLFGPDATPETHIRAVQLLQRERCDASCFDPYIYNNWIRTVKDEIVKREMFDLWRNEFVKKRLGLLWVRDCDYFDDINDPEPEEFYNNTLHQLNPNPLILHAYDVIPKTRCEVSVTFLCLLWFRVFREYSVFLRKTMSDNEESTGPTLKCEDFIITPDFTLEDYENNWAEHLCDIDESNDFEERDKIFHKFYNHIWNLLFGPDATPETHIRAVQLLQRERCDASFFDPFIYNDWIRTVKAEIVKREMFDLWRNEFVKKQLGLLWVRDCDYFDDINDPEPEEFYKLNL